MARIMTNLKGETVIRGEYMPGSVFLPVKPTGVKPSEIRGGTFRAYMDTPAIHVRRSKGKGLGKAIRLLRAPRRLWELLRRK